MFSSTAYITVPQEAVYPFKYKNTSYFWNSFTYELSQYTERQHFVLKKKSFENRISNSYVFDLCLIKVAFLLRTVAR